LDKFDFTRDFRVLGKAQEGWAKVKRLRFAMIQMGRTPDPEADLRVQSMSYEASSKWVVLPSGMFNIVWDSVINFFVL
jgi:hypothetical protein